MVIKATGILDAYGHYVSTTDAKQELLNAGVVASSFRVLRQLLAQAVKTLQDEIPQRLEGQDYKAESERIEQAWKDDVARHYAGLTAFAEARSFSRGIVSFFGFQYSSGAMAGLRPMRESSWGAPI